MDNFINLPTQSDVIAQAPQTTIYICGDIPWSNDYSHVRLFENKTALANFVKSKAVLPVIEQSTPVLFGELLYNIKTNQNALMRANYMMFKNEPFSSEWVYAFIRNVEWKSVNSALIRFELDVWQNNIYDCELESSFVEREHCSTSEDIPFSNLVPEGLESGDYICSDYSRLPFGQYLYCLMSSANPSGTEVIPGVTKNVYSGCNIYSYTDYTELTTLVQEFKERGNADAIVNIFMAPAICNETDPKGVSVAYPESLDGYVPKNKKLLQYPYCYVKADAYNGQSYIYYFEKSGQTNHSLQFFAVGTMVSAPCVFVYPFNYGGNPNTQYSYGFNIEGFPMCSWTNDAFQAYLVQQQPIWNAQESIQNVRNIQTAVGGIISTIQGDLVGGTKSVGDIIGSQFILAQQQSAQKEMHDLIPPTARGNTNTSNIRPALGINHVDFSVMTIMSDYAKRIDDYFSKFGYATNKIKIPNINNRKSWNFVKTVDCGIHGRAVMDDLAKLRTIFDAGVTIWHTNDIGNYALDNS